MTKPWIQERWNPFTGCKKVSAGCDNCYASVIAYKLQQRGYGTYKDAGFTFMAHPTRFDKPARAKGPRMYIVGNMTDLFQEDAKDADLEAIFDTMLSNPRHIFQVLTKHPERMVKFIERLYWDKSMSAFPNHIWLGTSIENQENLHRIEALFDLPPCLRWVDFSPLLGHISLDDFVKDIRNHLGWACIGGEVGPYHRTMRETWALNLIDQLSFLEVPTLFKGGSGPEFTKYGDIRGYSRYQYPALKHPLMEGF